MTTLYTQLDIQYINSVIQPFGTIHILNKTNLTDVFAICENIFAGYFQYIQKEYNNDNWEMIGVNNTDNVLCSFIIINKLIVNDKCTTNIQLICSSKDNSFYSQIIMCCSFLCIKRNLEFFNQECALEVAKYYYNSRAFCFYSKMGFKVDYSLFEEPFNFTLVPMKIDISSINETSLMQCLTTPNYRFMPKTPFCELLSSKQIIVENELFFLYLCKLESVKRFNLIKNFIARMVAFNHIDLLQDIMEKLHTEENTNLMILFEQLKPYGGLSDRINLLYISQITNSITTNIMEIPMEHINNIIENLIATRGGNKSKNKSYKKKIKNKKRKHKRTRSLK